MGDGGKYLSAERGLTNNPGRTPRPKGPCYPKCPLPTGPQRQARVEEWRYARSVVVQWLASLFANAQFLNDGFVALGIRLPEVIEQAATLAHHHEKAAPGGMVLLMRLEMLRQFTNPRTQDRDLDLGRAGVSRVRAIGIYNRLLMLSG